MSRNTSRLLVRTSICLVAPAFVAIALAACGDEDEQSLTFTLTEQGKQRKVTGPESAGAGIAEITLKNDGQGRKPTCS